MSTTETNNGASSVSDSEDFWRDAFLKRYGLFDGIKGHCEVTEGGIKRERMDEDGVKSTKPQYIKMLCLRIGKYKHRGLTVKATTQINNGQFHSTSVTFNHKHRTARRRLFNDIRDDFTKYLFDDRLDEVMRWVEMTDVFDEPLPGNTVKDSSDGSDVDSDGSHVEEDKVVEKAAAVGADDEDEKKPPAGKDLKEEAVTDISPDFCEDIMQGLDIDELIKQHAVNVSNNNTGTAKKGVKEDPHLKKRTIVTFPCLHGMLGVGNAIMDFFFDEIDRFVEPITRAELAVRESIPNNKLLLEEEENSLKVL